LVTNNPPWAQRQGQGILVYKDKLWLIGRLVGKDIAGQNDVWYSEDGCFWEKTEQDAPWTGREDAGVVIFKDNIWVLGGMDGNWEWKNDVWRSNY